MRIAKFDIDDETLIGLVEDDTVVELAGTLDALIAGGPATRTGRTWPLPDVTLRAPLGESCRGLICAGINYRAHQEESSAEFVASEPTDPIMFLKTVASAAAPASALRLDALVSESFDWEVELGVVIGTGGRHISEADAPDHIFGYTIVNDVTARDLQKRHQQWFLGKSVDASSPVGPWIVTADEVGWPVEAQLTLQINGVQKQNAHTKDMIFDVVEQIATVSNALALQPGDVIATGTPAGVGFVRQPPEFLQDGDLIEASIDGIGTLRNTVEGPT